MRQATPLNHQKQDHSSQAIAYAVQNAVNVAEGYLYQWQHHRLLPPSPLPRPMTGARVLEVGPGNTLGTAVLLACAGARVVTADRFLPAWDPEFHEPFFAALLEHQQGIGAADADTAPIRRLLDARCFDPEVVESHALASEDVWRLGRRFNVVYSNAVLEHVQDLQATVANIAAVTESQGHGFHQVDFRDHRSFDRPLEFLTMPSTEYEPLRQRHFCEHGCQWRLSTVRQEFERAGFDVRYWINLEAEMSYVTDVRARLAPEFANLADEDLIAASALLAVKRRT